MFSLLFYLFTPSFSIPYDYSLKHFEPIAGTSVSYSQGLRYETKNRGYCDKLAGTLTPFELVDEVYDDLLANISTILFHEVVKDNEEYDGPDEIGELILDNWRIDKVMEQLNMDHKTALRWINLVNVDMYGMYLWDLKFQGLRSEFIRKPFQYRLNSMAFKLEMWLELDSPSGFYGRSEPCITELAERVRKTNGLPYLEPDKVRRWLPVYAWDP